MKPVVSWLVSLDWVHTQSYIRTGRLCKKWGWGIGYTYDWIDEEKPCVSWTTPWVNFLCAFIGFLSFTSSKFFRLFTHCWIYLWKSLSKLNGVSFDSRCGCNALQESHSCQVSCCPLFQASEAFHTFSPTPSSDAIPSTDWTLPPECPLHSTSLPDCFHDLHHHHTHFIGTSVAVQWTSEVRSSGILLQSHRFKP